MNSSEVTGVVPIIPTPFRTDETIDFEAAAASIEFAVQSGISAVCLPAYASEFYKLTADERDALIDNAVQSARGRLKVIGQSNHPSAKVAAAIARGNEQRGVDLISFALPRQFALPEPDLLAYCQTICSAVSLPILVQDFNPAGSTIGPEFCRKLHELCPNFRYAKLEEPMMASKVEAILVATSSGVGVLEGWGGMYLLELIQPGICGVMPGLAIADLLSAVWELARSEQMATAMDLFEKLLPQIVYSLQSMELFLWMEKDLLARRGVFPQTSTMVRSATIKPDKPTWEHAVRLNQRIAELCSARRPTHDSSE